MFLMIGSWNGDGKTGNALEGIAEGSGSEEIVSRYKTIKNMGCTWYAHPPFLALYLVFEGVLNQVQGS